MAGQRGPAPAPPGAIALLGGAIRYALGVCAQVTAAELALPTPCADWDLAALLAHLAASMADLESSLRTGFLDLGPADPAGPAGPVSGDPVEVLRDQAANLLVACYVHHAPGRFVVVSGMPLAAVIVTCAAALEVAVHGWDVSAARGRAEEIPPALAARMLGLCPLLVVSRAGLFAPPVEVPAEARPGDRLVAYLGRDPAASAWATGRSELHRSGPGSPEHGCH
jgi:uncharacterized protein (TIGR03086 family)